MLLKLNIVYGKEITLKNVKGDVTIFFEYCYIPFVIERAYRPVIEDNYILTSFVKSRGRASGFSFG